MKVKLCAAVLALAAAWVPAAVLAHGGGGGGGHGGGHATYIPIYIPGGTVVSEVPAPTLGDTSGIHTVAIVSGIGQTLTLGRAGWLAQHSNVDIADWKLDDAVDSELRQYLAGRFTFVTIPQDRAALAAIPNGKLDSSNVAATNYLASLPAQGIDAFIVVRPDGEGMAATPGLSLANDEDAGGRPVIHANYEIDIVDAKTRQIISHTFSRVSLRQGEGAHYAALLGNAAEKVEPNQIPTDAQRAAMKAGFSHLVSISLIETVRSLNLGVALPQPGARVMVPIPANISLYPRIKTVAVISAVGDALDMNHRAPFFVHTEGSAPIADWNIDATIESDIRAALDPRFTVKPAVADRAKIANMRIAIDQAGINTPIDGLTPSNDVDLYIVVLKRSAQLGLDTVSGLGIGHVASFSDERTSAFAYYEIAAIDPHTLKPVLLVAGRASPAQPMQIPIRYLNNSAWPATQPLSPDQAQTVRQLLTDMMADSIPETLLHMGLTGMMPSGELPPAPQTATK